MHAFDDSVLGEVFAAALEGRFPRGDGDFTVVPLDETTGLAGVYSFTGHSFMSSTLTYDELKAVGADGYGGATDPQVLLAIAGPIGWVGVLDNVTVRRATGRGTTTLVETDAYEEHHRVRYARRTRADVRVFADERGLVTLGRGIGGRLEVGLETFGGETLRSGGAGRAMLQEILAILPAGTPLFACSAPGNARSLRSIMAVGFELIGSEVLIGTTDGTSPFTV